MYIFAGHTGKARLNDYYRFDTQHNVWSELRGLNSTPEPSSNYSMEMSGEGRVLNSTY